MGRIANYSNTQKYSDKKSFDGKPVEEGKVLVPFKKEDMNLMPGEYIYDNFTTFHLGEFKIVVGFMAISEGYFASYMQEFWDKLNKELEAGREGRCVIVKNADGTDKLCPFHLHGHSAIIFHSLLSQQAAKFGFSYEATTT